MEWIKNNLPLITVLMLLLGMVDIVVYYQPFNINIISFLDVSEVIQLQFTLYLFFLWAIISFVPAIYWVLEKIYKRVFDSNDNRLAAMSKRLAKADRKIADMKQKYAHLHISEFDELTNEHDDVVDSHSELVKSYAKTKNTIHIYIALAVFIVAGLTSAGKALYDAYQLKTKSIVELSMQVGDKPIATSRNYRYLGRVKNFIFFYDYAKRESYVFNNSEVKELTFKEGIDYSKPPAVAPVNSKSSSSASDVSGIRKFR